MMRQLLKLLRLRTPVGQEPTMMDMDAQETGAGTRVQETGVGTRVQNEVNNWDVETGRRTRCCSQPMKNFTDVPLFRELKPLFFCLKFFGLLHTKEYKNYSYGEETTKIPPLRKRITASTVYSFVVVCFNWLNVARLFSGYAVGEGGSDQAFLKVVVHTYNTLVAVAATCCFMACHKYTNMPEFFYQWAELHRVYPGKRTG